MAQNKFTKSQMHSFLESCHFPTTPRREKENFLFDTLKLDLSGSLSCYADGLSFQNLEKGLKTAWAILLRNYVGKLSVSFVVASMDYLSGEWSSNDMCGTGNTDIQIPVYRYQVPERCSLENAHEDGPWNISTAELEKTRINTGILFTVNGQNWWSSNSEYTAMMNNFDLVLEVQNAHGSSECVLVYRFATISSKYANCIATSFKTIWKEIMMGAPTNFRNCISDESWQKMVSWNPIKLYSQMTCMHYLVEAAVRMAPQADAVCAWDGSLTYSQLDTLSSIAAKSLTSSGVKPGMYIPFAYEKSMWTVVSTLAILKAGAAFVPLDPNQPIKRLQGIVASTGADVVVTSALFTSKFSGMAKHVVEISSRTTSLNHTEPHTEFYSTVVTASDAIFVLFTSGSTGIPKGIVHEHGAICTHAITHGRVMGYQGARVLQFAAHTFDVAIIDIFTTLIFGGCVCIPSEEARQSNIIGAINDMKADYAILTPSFARVINPSEVPTLKTLAVGGEALPQDGLQKWMENVSLIQIYGPAEVGICLSIKMRPHKTRSETVGYPLPNCCCWLVDPEDPDRLVPIGAVGELIVGGPSLAREYLNDESRTRASFLSNLAWAKDLRCEFKTLFRTGDLLRYNTDSMDGSFDFVGRKDVQIKLRGQRIEPGEIEHHMAEIPGVAISMVTQPYKGYFMGQLVVLVQMQGPASSRVREESISLVPNPTLSFADIKQHISKAVPRYMVPTMCLFVETMPMLPSMKINRKMVESWLNNMAAAPALVGDIIRTNLRATKLDTTELTARKLSIKIAELVFQSDLNRRIALENHDFVLQASGIDSIQIISFHIFLQREFRVKLPVASILNSTTTIRDLAYMLDSCNIPNSELRMVTAVDIVQKYHEMSNALIERIEATQHRRIKPEKTTSPDQNIFVTGVSGYLGIAILRKLLGKPEINIFALVRCSDESHGLERIINSCKTMGWWNDCFRSRIQVWKGDLAQKDLGLSSHQLKCLKGTSDEQELQIHAIIHNGAKVHYSSDYHSLEHVNVNSTSWLLEITASSRQIVSFVFVSGGQKPEQITDFERLSVREQMELNRSSGYTQTKLVSEFLVRRCANHHLFLEKRACIIKPGYIIGSSPSGFANQTDFIWRLIAGCLEIGFYNQDETNNWLFIADVDQVSDYVISPIFGTEESFLPISLISDGLRFVELWEILRDEFGYNLKGLPFQDWASRLKAAILKSQESHLLFPLMHILEKEGGMIGSVGKPAGFVAGSDSRVHDAVKSNIRYLIDTGFMPKARA